MQNGIDEIVIKALEEFAARLQTEVSQQIGAAGLGSTQPLVEVVMGAKGPQFSLSLPGHLLFVEYGVKGTERVPPGAEDSPFAFKHNGVSKEMIGSIRQWMEKRGIEAKTNKGSRKRLKEAVGDKQTALAFAIAKSVKKNGLSPKKFMEKTLTESRLQQLADTVAAKLQQEINVLLTQQ